MISTHHNDLATGCMAVLVVIAVGGVVLLVLGNLVKAYEDLGWVGPIAVLAFFAVIGAGVWGLGYAVNHWTNWII